MRGASSITCERDEVILKGSGVPNRLGGREAKGSRKLRMTACQQPKIQRKTGSFPPLLPRHYSLQKFHNSDQQKKALLDQEIETASQSVSHFASAPVEPPVTASMST